MHDEIRFKLQLRHGNEGATFRRTFEGDVSVEEIISILREAAEIAHVHLVETVSSEGEPAIESIEISIEEN